MKKISIILSLSAVALLAAGFINYNHTIINPNSHSIQQEEPLVKIGDKAKDIVLKDPEGKEITLSSLKGNLILIDFWASWCGPCRMENPNLVRAFEKYKDSKFKSGKKFIIYSVSLDKNAEAWKKAITADKLNWPYHVSDLGGWKSSVVPVYGINYIPQNFLIDGSGIVIAANLRGAQLEEILTGQLK